MVYIFEREADVLRVETRYTELSKTFEITCRYSDGTMTLERFTGEASFRARLDEIRTALEKDAWHAGAPHLLEDGWNI